MFSVYIVHITLFSMIHKENQVFADLIEFLQRVYDNSYIIITTRKKYSDFFLTSMFF